MEEHIVMHRIESVLVMCGSSFVVDDWTITYYSY